MRNPLDGTGDRVLGYAYCPQCERVMRRTDARIVAEAVLVQFECPGCQNMIVTCALVTEDDRPIRLDWWFCGIEAGVTLIADASAWHAEHPEQTVRWIRDANLKR
jgi:hypothetical protein